MSTAPKIGFFGTPQLAVSALDALEAHELTPSLIITNPDKAQGRKHIRTSSPVKIWAESRAIPLMQPSAFTDAESSALAAGAFDLFVVFAYGSLLPQQVIDAPRLGTINLHPSLLPRLRGASPIRSAILEDMRATGVSIIRMDEKMDHGPVLAQKEITIDASAWPMKGRELDTLLVHEGSELLASTIPRYLAGAIAPAPQDDADATFCSRIEKKDGELIIDPFHLPSGEAAYQAYLKICAYDGWPGTFFMHKCGRVKIVDASLREGALSIISVVPEGKREMPFAAFLNSLN